MLTVTFADQQQRCAAWIRQHHARHASKALQRILDIGERRAERILAGRINVDDLAKLETLWGERFTLFVRGHRALDTIQHFWATADAVYDAPDGLDAFARSFLRRSSASGVDFCALAQRNLGWVAITLSGDSVVVEFNHGATPAALLQTRDWLAARAHELRGMSLRGQETTVAAAIAELGHLAVASSAQDRALEYGWHVERKRLESVSSALMQRLLTVRNQAGAKPGTLHRVLYDVGALANSAIYTRRPDGRIITTWVGPALGIKAEDVVGREFSERADGNEIYTGLLRSRLEGSRIEPTLHRLRGCIAGSLWDYDSLANAEEPGPDGSQSISVTVDIHGRQRVAA